MNAIICIGESFEERKSGITNDVLKKQLDAVKDSITDWSKVVLAYEPVWAIGTGEVATPEQAQDAHCFIRMWIAKNVSREIAVTTRIQYGGSANAKNASGLICQPDIDGFLVGGASLKPDFASIVSQVAADNAN